MIEECRDCKFYQIEDGEGRKQAKDSEVAICMRFPPVYITSEEYPDEVTQWYQPTVIFNDWCGEYKSNDRA